MRRGVGPVGLVAACAALLAGCEAAERVADRYRALTPHEAYTASLEDAGLASTALGREWREAAGRAVSEPVRVSLPHREMGFIAPESPSAVGYRIALRRGQVLTIRAELDPGTEASEASEASGTPEAAGTAGDSATATRLFLDLFRLPADPDDPDSPPRPVQSAESRDGDIVYEPWRAGEYLVRLQPELLRGGRYTLTLSLDPSLDFPVEGRDARAIQSFFGAARDGGRRDHHGVDIFAPRGTPVLAGADGTVSRANVTGLGGKVVWLRDGRMNQSLYYAHLDSQVVARGDRVRRGDTLGFVGNSGNARTTPPHLHFGIYRRGQGPVDPLDFVRLVAGPLPALPTAGGGLERLGTWVRARDEGVRLRAGPGENLPALDSLGRHTPLRILGGTAEWWRVRLPDGREGYTAARLTEDLERAVERRRVGTEEVVRASPVSTSPVVEDLGAGAEVAVLGRYEGFDLVEAGPGRRGWVARSAPAAPGR